MLTFEKATALLQAGRKKTERKIANNTILHKAGDDIAIRLHATDVVTIHADGRYTLNSGGWRTVTTKARINEYTPARLSQSNGVWRIGGVEFADGIKISATGEVVAGGNKAGEGKRQKLLARIKKYIDGFASHVVKNGLQKPGNGDCWGCLFKAADGTQNVLGLGHILQHFQESYYVPSLLANAIDRNPIVWGIIEREASQGKAGYLKKELRRYFRKLMPELLKL